MKIITIMNDTTCISPSKFTGAYISKELDDKLTLMTIAEGVNKSTLIRKSISSITSSKNLVDCVAERMFHLFQMKSTSWQDFSSRMFKVYVEKELRIKGVRPSTITNIFESFDRKIKE